MAPSYLLLPTSAPTSLLHFPSPTAARRHPLRPSEHLPTPYLLRSLSDEAHGAWILLLPTQLAEPARGHELGFYYPRDAGGERSTGRKHSVNLGGPMAAAPAERESSDSSHAFVPITDVRTTEVGLCSRDACMDRRQRRVLVRYELTSIPLGVRSIQAIAWHSMA